MTPVAQTRLSVLSNVILKRFILLQAFILLTSDFPFATSHCSHRRFCQLTDILRVTDFLYCIVLINVSGFVITHCRRFAALYAAQASIGTGCTGGHRPSMAFVIVAAWLGGIAGFYHSLTLTVEHTPISCVDFGIICRNFHTASDLKDFFHNIQW